MGGQDCQQGDGLRVRFDQWERRLVPGEVLTFGREADLSIDNNRFLHRRLGEFRHHAASWWLHNVGSILMIDVVDTVTGSRMSVTPGGSVPVAFGRSVLRFEAGQARYQLELELDGVAPAAPTAPGSTVDDVTITIGVEPVSINLDQRLLLTALCEARLRDPLAHDVEAPTNRAMASRLGWSMPKFNRKLDNLCAKFDRLGVVGLKGDLGGLAGNRRLNLMDHAIRAGIVTAADLGLLDRSTGTQRSCLDQSSE